MDAYDEALVPPPFGLANPGTLCYLNCYLQVFAGLSAFTRAVLDNEGYLSQTDTGLAMLAFVRAYSGPAAQRLAPDIAAHSGRILAALTRDLAARRPWFKFGGGQESASELFVLILDMMEPPPAGADGGAGAPADLSVASVESPITRLFLHRYRCQLHCRQCRTFVSTETDHAVVFNLFHIDRMKQPPCTLADFSNAVYLQVSETDDYHCPTCKAPTKACRLYTLTMVPEVIVCAFNLYVEYGGARRARYFPRYLEFPAVNGGKLTFRLVGQVEHAGSLGGGHYWARGLRADRAYGPGAPLQAFCLNDTGVSPTAFASSPNTYLLAYHFEQKKLPAGEA